MIFYRIFYKTEIPINEENIMYDNNILDVSEKTLTFYNLMVKQLPI